MDQQSSQELLIESKGAGFSRVQKPKVATMQLQLLPYDVLRDTLSRLSIKDVVRMSTLSLEWRLLMICHPELVFTKDTFGISTDTNTDPDRDFYGIIKDMNTKRASWTAELITNVDSVLRPLWSTSTTTTTTLGKFAVEFGLRRKHKHHIDRYVNFSIASRAKHIAFDFTFDVNCSGSRFDKYKYIFPLQNLSGPNASCVKYLDLGYVLRFSENQTSFINLRHLNLNLELAWDPYDDSLAMGFLNILELAPLLANGYMCVQVGRDRCCPPTTRMVTAVQGPLHHHLKSVHMSGFCDVLGLAELALYILGNATVLQRMVVDPVAYAHTLRTDDIYSVSKAGSIEGGHYHADQNRMFAEQILGSEEFRHIVTIYRSTMLGLEMLFIYADDLWIWAWWKKD
ncbi:uncharacterized protein [Triticum aestivum]|uniref:uncharacterized protein n=1 Tax=Triticum aestivum TaxID=4565 RepID=UPI001D00CDFA|nr:uncharacterized protein LOC123039721 [Triticum aestivum]